MVREIDASNTDKNGQAKCNYQKGGNECPLRSTWKYAATYSVDNDQFLVSACANN